MTVDSLQKILWGEIERIGQPEAALRMNGLDRADNFMTIAENASNYDDMQIYMHVDSP